MRRRFTGNSQGLIIDNYLTIVALEDGLTARFFPNVCEYCIDGSGEWIVLSSNMETPAINTGQTLSFRASLRADALFGIGQFVINKLCNLEGNCMSMLYADKAVGKTSLMGASHAFSNLFVNASTIVSVARGFLPATTIAASCYSGMFSGCTSLTTAPELPATTIAASCYSGMFSGCTSLTTAPELPATTLDLNCYNGMFSGCTSLTTAPELPATTLVPSCYSGMFRNCKSLNYIKAMFTTKPSTYTDGWVYGVASTGTFVKSKDATWNVIGNSGVPSGWTIKKE